MEDQAITPQPGTWTLIAPDGRQWQGDSPLKVACMEQEERIKPIVCLETSQTAQDHE